jgi:hypothetical protein
MHLAMGDGVVPLLAAAPSERVGTLETRLALEVHLELGGSVGCYFGVGPRLCVVVGK